MWENVVMVSKFTLHLALIIKINANNSVKAIRLLNRTKLNWKISQSNMFNAKAGNLLLITNFTPLPYS